MVTILVVDDEPAIRRILELYLAQAGHAVIATDSPVVAIKAAPDVDVAVFDVQMPEMNGVELLRRVRAMKPGLPAVFISGYTGDVQIPPDCRVINKPFRREALIQAITDAVV